MTAEYLFNLQEPNTATLKESLLNNLPSFVKAFKTKEEFSTHFTYEPTHKVIDTAAFLRFNTKKFTNILIFDIDDFPSFGSKPSLLTMHEHFYNLTGFEPSWTAQTPRGYHIALILETPVFNTWKDNHTPTPTYLNMITLKQKISFILDADHNASNRSYGIWRNPLTHKHIFTAKTYTLTDLLDEFDIHTLNQIPKPRTGQLISNTAALKMSASSHNKIIAALEKGFYLGNRNHYLFAYGYKLLFENRKLSHTLENLLNLENQSYEKPLTHPEVKAITASIVKLSSTMYTSTSLKQRGKLSHLMWKLNIHGISKRRAFAGWHTSKERRTKTLTKITNTLLEAFEKGKTLHAQELASKINKSQKTIQRYEQKYNLNAIIFTTWHKAYQKRAASSKSSHKIDIRPFVQNTILHSLTLQFLPFTPSSSVQTSDLFRKKEYLAALYPLQA